MSVQRLSRAVARAGKGTVKRAARPGITATTLDMGDFGRLRGVTPRERRSHENTLEKVSKFSQLRINDDLRSNILTQLLKSPHMPPTPVQKVAIKAIARSRGVGWRSWLIAAETGSGKTLAYLAPFLSRLIDENTPGKVEIKGLVLVPTLELANQVIETALKLAPRLRIAKFAGKDVHISSLAQQVVNGVDLAVGTPDKVLNLGAKEPALLARGLGKCNFLVIDEADSLMNQSFHPSTTNVIEKCMDLEDIVFVSATIPLFFDKILRKEYPQITRLVTPAIHRLPRHIDFRVVDVWRKPYNNSKHLALQQALYSIYHDKSEPGHTKRVVVFVNRKTDVVPLVNLLNKAGYPASSLDSVAQPERQQVLGQFVEPAKTINEANQQKLQVLVATDLVARGIDFHRIRNIILYDMPYSAADLLHRAGRTGRLGTKGRVILFVSKTESKGWLRGLETVVKNGLALA